MDADGKVIEDLKIDALRIGGYNVRQVTVKVTCKINRWRESTPCSNHLTPAADQDALVTEAP